MPEEKQNQNQEKPAKPSPSPEQKTTKREIKCYKCGKPGHMSFNCGKGRGKPSQGYLLCMTPLTTEQSEFPPCNVRGKINGKFAEMVVDSGCTRTLVHRKYVNSLALTGDKITVLTAAGERLTVPLAKVEFDSKEGKQSCRISWSFGQATCRLFTWQVLLWKDAFETKYFGPMGGKRSGSRCWWTRGLRNDSKTESIRRSPVESR